MIRINLSRFLKSKKLSFNFPVLLIWMNSNGIVRQTLNGIWINEACLVFLSSTPVQNITLFPLMFLPFFTNFLRNFRDAKKSSTSWKTCWPWKNCQTFIFVEPAKRFNTSVKIFDLIYRNCEIKKFVKLGTFSLKIYIFLWYGKIKMRKFEVYISIGKVWLSTLQRTCSSQYFTSIFLFELKIDLSTSQWLEWKTLHQFVNLNILWWKIISRKTEAW